MQELILSYQTPVISEWIDYNGHMRDAYYFLILSYATDSLMETLGLDEDGRSRTANTLYTLEAHINYLAQAKLNDFLEVRTRIIDRDTKRLHIMHYLYRPETSQTLAASEQLLMNIDLKTGRSGSFAPSVASVIADLFKHHESLGRPDHYGQKISIRK